MACACSLVSVAGPSTMNCFALPSWSVPPPDAAGVVVSSGGRGLPMAARPGRFLRCQCMLIFRQGYWHTDLPQLSQPVYGIDLC